MRRVLLLLSIAACECGESGTTGEATESPSSEALTPAVLFPLHAGDRWALRSGDEESLQVVTAVTPEGVGVLFGSDRTSAERYRVSDAGVELVAPDGTVLAPYLDAPVSLAHEWSYELGDTRCVAIYATVRLRAEVAGTPLSDCVEVRRRCELPAGKPFPVATAQLGEELWCPRVGRVRETVRFSPAPSLDGFPAEKTWTVTYYRVEGAPALSLPSPFDCARFLLSSTDVQAACGPGLRPAGAADVEGTCRVRFAGSGGVLEVRARRFERAPSDEDRDAMLLDEGEHATAEETLRVLAPVEVPVSDERSAVHGFSLVEGEFAVAVRADDAVCTVERARRLEPLLRSLVRR